MTFKQACNCPGNSAATGIIPDWDIIGRQNLSGSAVLSVKRLLRSALDNPWWSGWAASAYYIQKKVIIALRTAFDKEVQCVAVALDKPSLRTEQISQIRDVMDEGRVKHCFPRLMILVGDE